ncbi:MAG: EAL domain-containing protein [Alcaligenaceae bacterium]|nr:EAL domain-containing protein [Alcaligenaceae bacterium]
MRKGSIYRLSLWVLPLAIALFTAMAVMGFTPLYPATSSHAALSFRSIPVAIGHPTPQEAMEALRTVPQRQHLKLDNSFWVSIDLPRHALNHTAAVDFPARGVRAAACWRSDTLEILGSASGRSTNGAMRNSRLGYAILLGQSKNDAAASFSSFFCQISYSEPTVFTAELWEPNDLRAASHRFHRAIALLDGGIATLAVFLAIIAIRNREWAFLLVSVWLIGNLRLGAYALGWDNQWLGYALPLDWQTILRKITLATYYLVTYTLFRQLFRQRESTHPALQAVLLWMGVAQFAAALLLPWSVFQPLSWLTWAVAALIGLYLLGASIAQKPKRLFSWRFVSLTLALAVMLGCLALALTGQEHPSDPLGNVVILLLSNIMVALAVSGMIRASRKERMRAQTELVTSYAVAPLGLFTLDANGHFLQMNPILRNTLGLKDGPSAPLYWDHFFPPQNWQAVAAATLKGTETEIHLEGGDQPERHFALRAVLADDHVEGSLQDITARAQAMAELRDMADSDPLTHALNRRGIEKSLEQAIDNLKNKGEPCSIGYMDLDHFRRINGLFGHTSGDEILTQITERLRRILTRQQSLGRIGSDEFIILFPNMDAHTARQTAEHIIVELNGHAYQVGHRSFNVRSAIGVVELNRDMDKATAISAATRACRDARKQHKDIIVYEQGSSELEAHSEELRLFDQLEGGDSPKGLYLEMQPIMDLNNPEETLNFEILLRVRDSHGGLIPTHKIVSGAEESGTITIIDKWVFSATLEWLSKHEDRLRKTQLVNINLSGVSLNSDQFIENLFQVLARYPQLTHRLCVEITEGVALQNIERTHTFIARLKSMGVRIALDDFGAGYTSFNYLKQLDADAVKIDGVFVRDMLASDTNIAIVRTIVELAQNMGMVCIAEWVEDAQALELLREMGVDYVQGYAVSAALTPMEILDAETVSDVVGNPDTLAYIRRHS